MFASFPMRRRCIYFCHSACAKANLWGRRISCHSHALLWVSSASGYMFHEGMQEVGMLFRAYSPQYCTL